MERLRALDQIAYIRFASVYQSFDDLEQLKREVDTLFADARTITRPDRWSSSSLVGAGVVPPRPKRRLTRS